MIDFDDIFNVVFLLVFLSIAVAMAYWSDMDFATAFLVLSFISPFALLGLGLAAIAVMGLAFAGVVLFAVFGYLLFGVAAIVYGLFCAFVPAKKKT